MTTKDKEAEAIEQTFNQAIPDYSPKIEWFGMSLNHDTREQRFVFEAESYIDPNGIEALQDANREITYIEAYQYDGDVGVHIHIPVTGQTTIVED